MKQINAVSYCRYSSDHQQQSSIAVQLQEIRKYCAKNSLNLIHNYIDEAQSGTNDRRHDFQQMIRDAKDKNFEYVVVHRMDRWARNVEDSLTYKRILKQYGVKLISVTDCYDDDSPEGSFFNLVNMGLSELYSKKLAREAFNGLIENAKHAKPLGGIPPYGYIVSRDRKHYEIVEEEAEVVRIIFKMTDDGASYKTIAKYLNQKGYKTRKDEPFRANFHDILVNRKYIGEYVFNRTQKKGLNGKRNSHRDKDEIEIIRIPGGMPAIIDEDIFNRVQKRMKNRTCLGKSGPVRKFKLSGLVICGLCGHRMGGSTYMHTIKSRPAQFECRSKSYEGLHTTNSITITYLEDYITKLLSETLLNEENAVNILNMISYAYDNLENHSLDRLVRLRIERDALSQDIKSLANALAMIDERRFNVTSNELEGTIRNRDIIVKEISEIEKTSIEFPKVKISDIKNRMVDGQKMLRINSISEVREFLYTIIDKIIINRDKVETIIKLDYFLNQDYDLKIDIIEDRINISQKVNHDKQHIKFDALSYVAYLPVD